MGRKSVPVGSLPNSSLLAEISKEAFNEFYGTAITPEKIAQVEYYINLAVKPLIDSGDWATVSLYNGRIIEFKTVLVIHDGPNELSIIPVWEYAEEE